MRGTVFSPIPCCICLFPSSSSIQTPFFLFLFDSFVSRFLFFSPFPYRKEAKTSLSLSLSTKTLPVPSLSQRSRAFGRRSEKVAAAPAAAMKPLKIEEMVAKKLALWHTRTFRPILTHEELEPIMAAAGFVPLPPAAPQEEGGQATAAVAWREYASRSEAARRRAGPRPRLPYPRIDGLHLMAYKAFLVSLEFYLGPTLVPNLFHVRTMSLTRLHDRVFEKAYRPMKDCEMDDKGILVYREGTLDHVTKMICSQYGGDDNNNDDDDDSNSSSTACIIGCTNNHIKKANCNDDLKNAVSLSYLVPLKDLFPSGDVISSLS